MAANGTSLVNDVDPTPIAPPAAKKSATSRVAQLGAKIKSVATIEKSRLPTTQKRPAPALPQEVQTGGERTHELNSYIRSKARGEVRLNCCNATISIRHMLHQ